MFGWYILKLACLTKGRQDRVCVDVLKGAGFNGKILTLF